MQVSTHLHICLLHHHPSLNSFWNSLSSKLPSAPQYPIKVIQNCGAYLRSRHNMQNEPELVREGDLAQR